MKQIQYLKNLFAFKGNINRFVFFGLVCLIELFRVAIISVCAQLSLSHNHLTSLLTDFSLMVIILYLYGIVVAGRLNNLNIRPNLTYFWILGIWFCKYAFLPLAHASGNMQFVCSAGVFFFIILLPLFAKDKKVFCFNDKGECKNP